MLLFFSALRKESGERSLDLAKLEELVAVAPAAAASALYGYGLKDAGFNGPTLVTGNV